MTTKYKAPHEINPECPICREDYYAVGDAYKICDFHLNEKWIVTTCPDCCIPRFSLTVGVCDICLEKSPKIRGHGFNKNHRVGLTRRGMGCKDNG